MTQEDKDLLLKDLCARLPYGVKIQAKYNPINIDPNDANVEIEKVGVLSMVDNDAVIAFACDDTNTYNYVTIHDVKPYLFPFSSMTEEQYESLRESGILSNCSHSYEYVNPHIHEVSFIFKEFKTYSLELIEWLNKNHFDYRGLIEKGLAVNAINLNIY
jgi:hypothetical protein